MDKTIECAGRSTALKRLESVGDHSDGWTRRIVFGSMLFVAMGAATFTTSSLGILATFIIDDLSISRAELGVVLAMVNVAAAVLSPVAGRVTDRIGGKGAIVRCS